MAQSLARVGSASSDLFDSDPAFLQALEELDIPEDDFGASTSRSALKRAHSPENGKDYMNTDAYKASSFGGFGQYMSRKRAKLQVQNAALDDPGCRPSGAPKIFQGLAIYINGFTRPSVQDLRNLIVQHGGVFHAYLDKKALVTHIITCSLTPAKIREFKHMKVVRPEWLVESVKSGILLPWQNFIFRPEERALKASTRKTAQKPLFPGPTPQQVDEDVSIEDHQAAYVGSDDDTIYITDPATAEQAAQIPGYAAYESNPHAERVMANPEWRAAHTSAAPDFIEGYYKNSRLHHLSTWKAELKKLVQEAQERAEQGLTANTTSILRGQDVSMRGSELVMKPSSKKGKEKDKDDGRIIMHCDFDSFFVSAGLVDRPGLRGKPVVVCHSQGNQGGESSTSEIASASYEARNFCIKNGMSLQQARKLCPEVQTIPYEFQKYRDFSLKFYTILMAHADDLQAVSVDEALIDVTNAINTTSSTNPQQSIKEYAESIRALVRQETACEVSIGISHNIMLARLATKKAKPAGSFHLVPGDVRTIMDPLDIKDLHGFGHSIRQKAEEKLGATKLGDLVKKSKSILCDALGKGTGETLYNALRGIDDKVLTSDKPRKSVSCEINYGIRFNDDAEVEKFIYQLSEEVSKRLVDEGVRGKSITLKVMKRDPSAPVEPPKFLGHGICEMFNKTSQLLGPGFYSTQDANVIGEHAWRLLRSFEFDPKELRGIGIQIQKLEKSTLALESGQAVLPFKAMQKKDVSSVPEVVIHPPSSQDKSFTASIGHAVDKGKGRAFSTPIDLDLPSFSQVDMSVYDALPDELKQELDAEYKRRSLSPALDQMRGSASTDSGRHSEPPLRNVVQGSRTRLGTNVKPMAQQLAPKNKSLVSLDQSKAAGKRIGPSYLSVDISDDELRLLGIDPEVFSMLPTDIKREQLAGAKVAKKVGFLPVAGVEPRAIIKPIKRKARSPYLNKPPFPKAVFAEQQVLKRQGNKKGEKLVICDTDDVQTVIGKWVEGFREHPPNQRDVNYFGKFLVDCVDSALSGDTGVEKAVKVAKWWQFLLRKYWALWETVDIEGIVAIERDSEERWAAEMVGRAWWRAFRSVKKEMDASARKKFGGCISLR